MPDAGAIAYLAQGKVFIAKGGSPGEPVDSRFVEELLDRSERNRQRNTWRDDSMACL